MGTCVELHMLESLLEVGYIACVIFLLKDAPDRSIAVLTDGRISCSNIFQVHSNQTIQAPKETKSIQKLSPIYVMNGIPFPSCPSIIFSFVTSLRRYIESIIHLSTLSHIL